MKNVHPYIFQMKAPYHSDLVLLSDNQYANQRYCPMRVLDLTTRYTDQILYYQV